MLFENIDDALLLRQAARLICWVAGEVLRLEIAARLVMNIWMMRPVILAAAHARARARVWVSHHLITHYGASFDAAHH